MRTRNRHTLFSTRQGSSGKGIHQGQKFSSENFQALLQHEQILESAYQILDEAVLVVNPQTRTIISCNPAAQRIFGYRKEEMLGRNSRFLHVSDKAYEEFGKLFREKGGTCEFQMRRRDGTVFETEHTVKHVTGERGQVWVSVIRDVTERKRAEEALRKSEALLKETQSITMVGGWEYDVSARSIYWTDEVYRIYGLSKDYDPSRIKKNISFYGREARPLIREAFRRAVEEGVSYSLELPFKNAKGERKWVRTTGKAERKEGKIVRVFGNILDITEQKLAQKELKAAEESARAMLNATLESMVLIGTDGTVRDINETGALRIGCRREEVIGRCLYDFFSPNVLKFRKRVVSEVISSCRPVQFSDFREGRFYDTCAYPVLDEQGKVARVAIFSADVTEKKEGEKELLRKEKELEEMNTALRVLLDQREREKKELAESTFKDVRRLVLPYLDRVEGGRVDPAGRECIRIIKSNLQGLFSRSPNAGLAAKAGLTPTEVIVADLIRKYKTSKEIATLMGVSVSAVFVHRYNLRRKLGILNKKVNLKSFLLQLN